METDRTFMSDTGGCTFTIHERRILKEILRRGRERYVQHERDRYMDKVMLDIDAIKEGVHG